MLAQLSNPTGFSSVGWLLLALAALCVSINQIEGFLDRRKEKRGEPPNEQLQVSQGELERRIRTLESELAAVRSNNRDLLTERSKEVFDKIDEVRIELKDDMQTQSDRRDDQIGEMRREFNDKLENLPERLVALLKNTGAI